MMDKIVRKALYTAVGIVAGTTERLQKVIDDLVSRGRLSEEEGKKVVDDVVKTSENQREDYDFRFRNVIDSVLSKLNLPQGDAYEKMEKRVKSLEVKLGLLAKELESQRRAAQAKTEEENTETPKKTGGRKNTKKA